MNRKGLTLIELLVAVGIVAVLTAITVPRFTDARERSFIAAMESDLGQLQMRQELHRRTGDRQYADELDELERFQPSQDVAITLVGDGSTWSAEAQHRGTSRTCAFDSSVGEIECTGTTYAPFPESNDNGNDGAGDSGDDTGDTGNDAGDTGDEPGWK